MVISLVRNAVPPPTNSRFVFDIKVLFNSCSALCELLWITVTHSIFFLSYRDTFTTIFFMHFDDQIMLSKRQTVTEFTKRFNTKKKSVRVDYCFITFIEY